MHQGRTTDPDSDTTPPKKLRKIAASNFLSNMARFLTGWIHRQRLPIGLGSFFRFPGFEQQGTPRCVEIEITCKAVSKTVQMIQRQIRIMDFRNGDSAVQRHDRRWLYMLKSTIQLFDLGPVCIGWVCRPAMGCRDRRLNLIWARATMAQRFLQQHLAFGNLVLPPQFAVLFIQRHKTPVFRQSGPPTRMLKKAKCQKSHDLRLSRKKGEYKAQKADRFLTQLLTNVNVATACGISLVEKQVDHDADGVEAGGPLLQTRRFQMLGRRRRLFSWPA